MKVVVTGAAGGVGKTLVPLLCSRSDVSQVIGIDCLPLHFSNPKFLFHKADMRSTSLGGLLQGAHAVIHLAFALSQGKMTPNEMHENNVGGSLNVLNCARAAKVSRVINLSSVSVYGSGEDLDEDAPLAPSPNFPYAQQKAELEHIATTQFSDLETIHLRSTFILGPNAVRFIRSAVTSRICILPRPPYPRVQVIHEFDVASAIIAALNPRVAPGVFNLAARDAVTVPELVKNGRSFMIGIPIALLERISRRRENGPSRPIDTALELLRATLTVSCRRAQTLLGWTPRYGIWEARASCDQTRQLMA